MCECVCVCFSDAVEDILHILLTEFLYFHENILVQGYSKNGLFMPWGSVNLPFKYLSKNVSCCDDNH